MKKILPALLALALFSPGALAASERANTLLIHPGETCYAKFAVNGTKLKLLGVTKEKDEAAQLVVTMTPDPATKGFTLKVENKFKQDLDYAGEIRSLTRDIRTQVPLVPVVAGKLSLEQLPMRVEEMALFGFKLEK